MKKPRLNDTSKRIAEDRYFNDSEKRSVDGGSIEDAYKQMCNRVASNVAHAENTPEERKKYCGIFAEAMYNQDMIPAGRFWANAGGENQQFPNCFVYSIKDTKVNGKDGIFDTLSLAAVTASGGGGTGFDFSRLRSRGIPTTKSKGVSSGPVAFIKSYDAIMENIRQGGTRRAANMGILRVDHPDILEFIFLKDKTQKFKRFNLSAAITDAFMKYLHEYPEDPWLVTDPKTHLDYKIFIPCDLEGWTKDDVVKFLMDTYTDARGEKIHNYMLRELHETNTPADSTNGFYITSKDIWDCITYNAWYCGDPGVFFIDTANASNCLINNMYDSEHPFYMHATNPCISEGSLISTERGLVSIENIVVGDKVATHKGFSVVTKVLNKGKKKTLKVITKYHRELICTSNHLIMTFEGWKKAGDLQKGDILSLQSEGFVVIDNEENFEKGFLAGMNFGDGYLSKKRFGFCYHPDDIALAQHVQEVLYNRFNCLSEIKVETQKNSGNDILKMYGYNKDVVSFLSPLQDLEEAVVRDNSFQCGFLQGYFASDGHIEKANGTIAIALTTIDKRIAQIIANMLLRLGIYSKVFKVPRKGHPSDVKYGFKNKPSYRVQIAGEDKKRFQELIGLAGKHMQDSFRETKLYNISRYDEVLFVKEEDKKHVYDLVIPGHNSFVAEGIVVHNCGEEAMEDNSICMLTSINLANFVIIDTDNLKRIPSADYERLREITSIAVRFLDDALDVSTYPSEYIKQHALDTRRIGLGVMGWADMLIKLKIKYGSEESLKIAEEVMKTINEEALIVSIELGQERGNFPLFGKSCYATGERGFPKLPSLRNSYRTMVAPTGTTSLLTGVNESIEPVFYFNYERKDETGIHRVENYLYREWLDDPKCDVDAPAPGYFITTNDIPYLQHIDMQAAFQRYIDVSISKTINMSSRATVEDVANAYSYAYESKCKGITVYRDKSKNAQVLNVLSSEKDKEAHSVSREEGSLAGLTWKVKTGDGTCFININKNGAGRPVEVFISVGKAGSDINAYSEALGRIISISLQHKVAPEAITKQLIGILGDSPIFHKVGKYHKVLSVPDAVGKVLEEFLNKSSYLVYSELSLEEVLKEKTESDNFDDDYHQEETVEYCATCQQPIYESEGCKVCGCGSQCD